MKIGIDARLWNETGVGRYIRNLVRQLEKIDKENEYTLFVTSEARGQGLGVSDERFKIIETNIRWHTVREQMEFPKLLEKEHLDLVHFPYFSVPIYYKRPFVITIHDLIINHYPTGKASTLPLPLYHLKHVAYQFIMKQAAKKAQKIITVSEATKLEIVDHLKVSADKIKVTYEGVDKNLAIYNVQRAESKEKYFLYVGNAYPHKNLEVLINAFKTFTEENKDTKLLLVGKEDFFYKRLKQDVRRMQIDKSVNFLGKVSDTELASLYSNALALVTPSLMEGFGLPPLEAMAHNCLVIASDISAHREICEDAAIYFNPKDKEDLLKILHQVANEKDKRVFENKIKEGANRLQNFSWEKMAEQTLKVYGSTFK